MRLPAFKGTAQGTPLTFQYGFYESLSGGCRHPLSLPGDVTHPSSSNGRLNPRPTVLLAPCPAKASLKNINKSSEHVFDEVHGCGEKRARNNKKNKNGVERLRQVYSQIRNEILQVSLKEKNIYLTGTHLRDRRAEANEKGST